MKKRILSKILILVLLTITVAPINIAAEPVEETLPAAAEDSMPTAEVPEVPLSAAEEPQTNEEVPEIPLPAAADAEADPSSTGPVDIWEAIFALEESAGAVTPEDYEALMPEVEDLILSSPSYEEGSLVMRDGILFWWSDDRMNGYSPEDRARENGYVEEPETTPELEELYDGILAQLEAELPEGAESLEGEAELPEEAESFEGEAELPGEVESFEGEAELPEGEESIEGEASGTAAVPEDDDILLSETAGETEYDVGVFLPYSGYDGGKNFYLTETLGKRVAYFTGGECISYKGTAATIDKLAELIQTCAVVLIGSHGANPGGFIGLKTDSGLTTQDYREYNAWYIGSTIAVNGQCIADHMTGNAADESLVLSLSCMGMKTNYLAYPLRSKGVDVVFGFSETVTYGGADILAMSFLMGLANKNTVSEAVQFMRESAGCAWDPFYQTFTLEEAQRAEVAFPIVVTDQDTYPGIGKVNIVQDVKGTWKLPVKPSADPYYGWTTKTVTRGTYSSLYANIETNANFNRFRLVSGSLPDGMEAVMQRTPGALLIRGTPTKKGLFNASYQITTTGGDTYINNVRIMVKDTAVRNLIQNIAFTAPLVDKWTDRPYLMSSESYYKDLEINTDDSTYSMEVIDGYLPYSLYCGFSDGAKGYIRSEDYPGYETKQYDYATEPGTYSSVLEIISYSGSVYHLTLNVTVNPRNSYVISDKYIYTGSKYKSLSINLPRDLYKQELTDGSRWSNDNCRSVRVINGRLPEGTYAVNSPVKPCGIYGIPEETGTFNATLAVRTFNDVYRYSIELRVDDNSKCGDNVYFSLSDDGVLDITGSGSMWDFSSESPPWKEVKKRIKEVRIGDGVTSIGVQAFSDCSNLAKITMADSVETIGQSAFHTCDALTDVKLSGNLESIGRYAFYQCRKLADISLPEKLKYIDDYAFQSCSSLKEITFPDSMTVLGERAFEFCNALRSVTFGESFWQLYDYAFSSCGNLKTIAFRGPAPDIEAHSFQGVTCYGYYPAVSGTWPASSLKNYGGNITWRNGVSDVSLDKTSLALMKGEKAVLKATVSPHDAEDKSITWVSSDKSLVTVDQNGNVTANSKGKAGTAVVSAVSNIGKYKADCQVRVLFNDVPLSHSYQKAVYWAVDNEIAAGYTGSRAGYFGVADNITRGQVVMFLWRAAGKPEPPANAKTFPDVPESNGFYKAILWASGNGIAAGYSNGKFGPSDNCTRGQIVMFLWRYAGKPAASTTQKFTDVPKSSGFFTAVQWASDQGITDGYKDKTFGVNKYCTRGQCVTFLYRMMG